MKKRVFFSLILLFFGGCATKEVCSKPEILDLSNETMSFIRGGEFLMGDYNDSFGDKPPKEVYVDSFFIDKTEVTNKMYREYLKAQKCPPKKPPFLDDPILGADNLPVVGVTYREALKFCQFYQKRLPTEAEWEYSAKGGFNLKKFPWGDEESSDFMNYRGSKIGKPVAVKSYPPNRYGLYDMAGNVREWVLDTYEKDFYKYSCLKSPLNPSFSGFINRGIKGIYKSDCYKNPLNLAKGSYKVNRGGSYEYSEGYPDTVSFRFFDLASYRGKDLGFRCASDAKKENWLLRKFHNFTKKFIDNGIDVNNLQKNIEDNFQNRFKNFEPPTILKDLK